MRERARRILGVDILRSDILHVAILCALFWGGWYFGSPWVHAQAPIPHVYGVYVNTGNVVVPVDSGSNAEAAAEVDVPVPDGALGICGWKLSATGKEPTDQWEATAFLAVGDDDQDHFRTHGAGQEPPHFLPSGLLMPASTVHIHARFFNEDDHPVTVRVNAWVWFVR
jgi:hypothetical protein